MKKFIFYGDTIKIFQEEKDLIKYLSREKPKKVYIDGKFRSRLDGIYIETVEINVLDTSIASKYLESYVENNKRHIKLNSVLGDELSKKVEKFKNMFLLSAKDDINKDRFLSQLEATPLERKSLSKLISGWAGYLFFVDNSVEWFRSILDIHNFRKIENSYVRELFDSRGVSRYVNMVIGDSTRENFEKAKSIK